jgi:hypothetical protein
VPSPFTGSTTERADFIWPTTFWARSGLLQKSGEDWSSSISFSRFSCAAKSKTLLELTETAAEGPDALLEFLDR